MSCLFFNGLPELIHIQGDSLKRRASQKTSSQGDGQSRKRKRKERQDCVATLAVAFTDATTAAAVPATEDFEFPPVALSSAPTSLASNLQQSLEELHQLTHAAIETMTEESQEKTQTGESYSRHVHN